MATSGTVAQTQVTVTDLIEHAVRRCGVDPSSLSGEQQKAAQLNLFFICADMANRGLSLFCVQKYVLGMQAYQTRFDLDTGVYDVLDCLYRTQTTLEGDAITGAAYSGIDLGDGNETYVSNVAVIFSAAGAYDLSLQYSEDNVTWTTGQAGPSGTAVAGQWVTFDAPNSAPYRYWRLLEADGTLLTVDTITFNNEPYEVNFGMLNRDDYVMFPNKQFNVPAGSKSLNAWFDKQLTPRLWIWPASQGSNDQIIVWAQHQIEDVGDLTDALAVPQRWYESVIFTLATRIALELPVGKLPEGRLEFLEAKAEYHITQAEDGETDGSPIRLLPNMSGYTR